MCVLLFYPMPTSPTAKRLGTSAVLSCSRGKAQPETWHCTPPAHQVSDALPSCSRRLDFALTALRAEFDSYLGTAFLRKMFLKN